jgi:hypothetical protein
MEQAMTQVYVDRNGYLWTFELVALPHSYAHLYEHEFDRHMFIDPRDGDYFREMLGMELLGEL